MKKLALFILLASIVLCAQDKSSVIVKSSQVASGVVLVTISETGKAFDLQCNDGHAFCKALKPGQYLMVRLPKNRGMYDCQNVDVFSVSADPETDEKLAEYCLNQKD
jgi:NAD(P)H-flavin reductase